MTLRFTILSSSALNFRCIEIGVIPWVMYNGVGIVTEPDHVASTENVSMKHFQN